LVTAKGAGHCNNDSTKLNEDVNGPVAEPAKKFIGSSLPAEKMW
jgi:hypothetical protein